MSALWYLVLPVYCETDVLDMYRVVIMCVTIGGGSFALCLFPSGLAYVTKMKGIAKEFVPLVLLPLPDAAPAALVCVAFAAVAQQLSSVLLLRALFVVGISFVVIAELSDEFLVYYCVHNVDGNVVLVVFVFMMQGHGEAQFGLYLSRTRRHAHPVGLRHARSFQEFWVSSSAGVPWSCSRSKVSNKGLGEVKEAKGVQFFDNNGNGVSSVVRSSSHAVVSDVLHLHADEYAVCGSRLIKMGCNLSQNGIANGSNVQVLRRLRGGAGAYLAIPGQWECKVCGATRCWPARKRCYRRDAPRDTVPSNLPWVLWDGRLLSRVALVLQLEAQGLVTFHRGKMVMEVRPLRGLVLVPVLVEMSLEKRLKLVNCCKP